MTLDCFATNPDLNPVAWITSCPVPGKWQCATHRDTSPIKPDQIPPSLGPGARTRPAPGDLAAASNARSFIEAATLVIGPVTSVLDL